MFFGKYTEKPFQKHVTRGPKGGPQRHLGGILGAFGDLLGSLGCLLGPLGVLWVISWSPLVPLGPSRAPLGDLLSLLAVSWGALEASWVNIGGL